VPHGDASEAVGFRDARVCCRDATTEMPIGLLTLDIHILDAQSLKDKRQVLRSLKDRLRAHYNVSVAELAHQDTWQRSVVGVVTIASDAAFLEKSLAELSEESEKLLGRDLVSQQIEYFQEEEA
jgi:uncharacterized protein YlxP (DUF503 family)